MNKIILLILAVCLLIVIFRLYSKPENSSNDVWLGFYYESAIYKTDPISQQANLSSSPKFSSIQDCMNWGNKLLSSNSKDGFECSRGCRYDKDMASIVCKETTKMITKLEKGGSWDY